jgi:hypothetical protein
VVNVKSLKKTYEQHMKEKEEKQRMKSYERELKEEEKQKKEVCVVASTHLASVWACGCIRHASVC